MDKVFLEREEKWVLREKYGGEASPAFEADARRLALGEPLEYVLGRTEFCGCGIDLSLRPLIPRVETEYWVGKVIEEMKSERGAAEPRRCLDLFCGSGCVGVAVLAHISDVLVDFADIAPNALEQTRRNLARNGVAPARFRVVASDVWSVIEGRYNYLFANPPYVVLGSPRVEESVKRYEPHEAVFGGSDGLDLVRRFLAGASAHLAPSGRLYMEFDDTQADAVARLAREGGLAAELHRDQYNVWRWLSARAA